MSARSWLVAATPPSPAPCPAHGVAASHTVAAGAMTTSQPLRVLSWNVGMVRQAFYKEGSPALQRIVGKLGEMLAGKGGPTSCSCRSGACTRRGSRRTRFSPRSRRCDLMFSSQSQTPAGQQGRVSTQCSVPSTPTPRHSLALPCFLATRPPPPSSTSSAMDALPPPRTALLLRALMHRQRCCFARCCLRCAERPSFGRTLVEFGSNFGRTSVELQLWGKLLVGL